MYPANDAEAEIIGAIYEAAVVPELWPRVLEAVALHAGCQGGLLISLQGTDARAVTSENMASLWGRFVEEGWAERNPRAQALFALDHAGFVSDYDAFTEPQLQSFPLYRDFLRPVGYGWGAGSAIQAPNGSTIIVSLERRYALGPMSREEVDRLDRLRPHLARAAVLAANWTTQRAVGMVDGLSAIGLPAALIAASGRLVAANPRFEERAGQIDIGAFDHLKVADTAAQGLLKKALAGIEGEGLAIRSLPVPAAAGNEPCVLHLLPVRRAANDLFGLASAIVVVTGLAGEMPMPDVALLRGLFDLTAAEARTGLALLGGLSIAEIARRNAISVETVRSQVRKVLAKTGAGRQAEFVARLAPLRLVRA
ncbi:helix-turn-helix transcriptional regulator [Aurantimonas sp. Leaf443]|uniref:helix-turn-helix transcriptional regulator n=1 Tax=Aurantimonas sp. Leaf443 TaxID=1736378 RepID=UPI0006FAB62B|nr:helix-turn-helix transcriptional regulator [Aurantimonas sp. Leaf443]KQT86138.1 hypothetical protein ASG48_06045 [Aurantimonas sp. Leaf443]